MSNEPNFRRVKNEHKLSFNKGLRKWSSCRARRNKTNLVRLRPQVYCGTSRIGRPARNPADAQERRSKQIFCKNSHLETLSHTYSSAIPPLFVNFYSLFVIFTTLSNVSKSPIPISDPKTRTHSPNPASKAVNGYAKGKRS